MIKLIKTTGENKAFTQLAADLEKELKTRDGAEHTFYAALNKIENIRYVVIAYKSKIPVGCGAIREHSIDAVELKRMYVKPENRRSGIVSEILKEPENWALWA